MRLLKAGAGDPSLYGRMDFVWCGADAPLKLLEYNADTPTSLYEAAVSMVLAGRRQTQRVIPRDADQYNAIQERLIARFSELYSPEPLYFCCCEGSDEDRTTVLYLGLCATGRSGNSFSLC